MSYIRLLPMVGSFAENKELAKKIRIEELLPQIKEQKEITLDFKGVDSTTQSFMHALLSDLIRKQGIEVLDLITFKNCSNTVKQIINIVVEYMQEGM